MLVQSRQVLTGGFQAVQREPGMLAHGQSLQVGQRIRGKVAVRMAKQQLHAVLELLQVTSHDQAVTTVVSLAAEDHDMARIVGTMEVIQ